MKGQKLPFNLTFTILLFLLIAIVVLSIIIFTSKDMIDQIKSGEIYKSIENLIKKWMGR